MKVIKADGMYKATRIAGPKHNYLGATVVFSEPDKIRIFARQAKGEEPRLVDESKLLACVTEGVAKANREAGCKLYIDYIEYVPSDTPDYKTYAELVSAILLASLSDSAGQ